MKKLLAAALLSLPAAFAHAGQAAAQVNAYFDIWLQQHEFHAYEKRADGLWFPSAGMRLDGDVYQVKEITPGKVYTVESRVTLTLRDGRRLEDFVGGMGTDPQRAFEDSLQNLCLTTLEPLYAALFDRDDANVRKSEWTIAGTARPVFLASWGQRGELVDATTQAAVERLIAQGLARAPLSGDIHWLKLVVLVGKDKLDNVSIAIDGEESPALLADLQHFDWPHPKTVSMAKLFVVIGPR